MKKIQVLFFALLICLFAANLYAQEQGKISGKILSTLNIPIEGAVISVTGSEDVRVDLRPDALQTKQELPSSLEAINEMNAWVKSL